jgi:BirA family transcriptional regulator, biotin operon repressor / biotin---[acetyl-CoA-carboxylase] ligase
MPCVGLAAAVDQLPPTWRGRYFDVVDSTQDESQSLFVADYQRAGRGRHARTWLSQPGSGLLVSMLFRETTAEPVPWRWTSLAAVALIEAIECVLPAIRPMIKWPNDVLVHDRKVAGVLAESTWEGRELLAIVGVGLNANAQSAELASVGANATSLRMEAGQPVDRGRLLLLFVERMDAWLTRPQSELIEAWRARLWGRGQRLRLIDLGREEEVIVIGAEADGSLRVRLSDGTERRTTTGELIC